MAMETEQHPGWAAWIISRVDPVRVAVTIVLGMLMIYNFLLWRKVERLENELAQMRGAQVMLRSEADGLLHQFKALQRRVPLGQFTLTPPAAETGEEQGEKTEGKPGL